MTSIPYRELQGRATSEISLISSDSAAERPSSTSFVLPSAAVGQLPRPLTKVHRALQALAQCQVMMGLVCCALGALYIANQGVFSRVSLGICVGLYFMVSGLIGICGSATYRRGLMVAYMVMSVHSTVLFAPALIAFSVVAMLLDQHGCYFQCDLFGQKLCRLLCQGATDWDWIPNESCRTVDIGLIVTACFELLLALVSAILCCRGVCEAFGLVDPETLQKVVTITTTTASPDSTKPLLQTP